MTELDDHLDRAKRRLLIADHFLTQTYPVLQDPKLLLSALDSLLQATEDMLDAIIEQEREAGKSMPELDSFSAKLAIIKGDHAKRYGLTHIDVAMMSEMQELLHEHKQSDVEFTRKGAYVMASKDFTLSTVTLEKLKTYLVRSKSLFTKIHGNITRH